MGAGQGAGPFLLSLKLFRKCGDCCEILKVCDRCLRTGCAVGRQVVRKIVLCHLFCIFLFIVVIVVIIIVPSFVVSLNCLYLNLQILLFVQSPPHHTGEEGRGERLAVQCLIAVCHGRNGKLGFESILPLFRHWHEDDLRAGVPLL